MNRATRRAKKDPRDENARAQDLAVYTAGAISAIFMRICANMCEAEGRTYTSEDMPVEEIADQIDKTLVMCGYKPIKMNPRDMN